MYIRNCVQIFERVGKRLFAGLVDFECNRDNRHVSLIFVFLLSLSVNASPSGGVTVTPSWSIAIPEKQIEELSEVSQGLLRAFAVNSTKKEKLATITIRQESASQKKRSLESYVGGWIKDFPKYGLQFEEKEIIKTQKNPIVRIQFQRKNDQRTSFQYFQKELDQIVFVTCIPTANTSEGQKFCRSLAEEKSYFAPKRRLKSPVTF